MYIADDMGLGKTIQALATAAAFKEEWPLLVVCPSSMRFAWKDAALRWIPGLDPEDVTVITSGKDYLCNGQMLVISYDLLSRKEAELLKKEYKVGFHLGPEGGIYHVSAVLLFTFEDCKPIQSIQKTIQNGLNATL